MTIAAEKVAGLPEKKEEKVEKRRALGRGLESLLPGPRVISSTEHRVPSTENLASSAEPRVLSPEPARVGEGAGETKVPRFARDDKGGEAAPPGTAAKQDA